MLNIKLTRAMLLSVFPSGWSSLAYSLDGNGAVNKVALQSNGSDSAILHLDPPVTTAQFASDGFSGVLVTKIWG